MTRLEDLVVIPRLEVGPPRVEPKRVVVPYRVHGPGGIESIELIYRYTEQVFDPASPAQRSLAAMMGAQVALNYGLFCRELVIHGELDEEDRSFVRRFAESSAREIYVNKILAPNPFLVGAAKEMQPEKPAQFLAARLVFDDEGPARRRWSWGISPDASRHLVLSSGGKESLLSHALLDELGREVHPVFVNESGHHWHTALEAFRQISGDSPLSARVWTNADRVFNFMLRHLPFVRQDYPRVRADSYPIRLWTVAVFLFGALPLALSRGVARIVIGCEFDTTLRSRSHGISHAAGLYDQSRHFDVALSRYFRAKGTPISQFSILRPLSELLVQKILVERYPARQALQTSCHATHMEKGRVRPCGRCEKCRRVVSMLLALGADPRACRYDGGQVARILEQAPIGRLHQEPAVSRHTLHLLQARGLIDASSRFEPCDEVMALRIDAERSPHESIPADLRPSLYPLFLEHASGALEKHGRTWIPVDVLGAAPLAAPFESAHTAMTADADLPKGKGPPKGLRFSLGSMTWPEAKERLRQTDLALLPVGALEQHGPHLPLDTDAFDAVALCEAIAGRCAAPRPLVLPGITYGVSYHHEDFPGTLSVSPDTLARLVYEVGMGAARNGVTKLVIVNGHGGNGPALHFAAQNINRDARIFTCVDTGESSDHDVDAIAETPNDVHAGEIETSTSLWLRPELVRMERAQPCVPRFSSAYLDFTSKRSVGWYARTRRISETGVLGDPTRASREKGRKMWHLIVENLVALVEDLKSMTLDEIHQTRY